MYRVSILFWRVGIFYFNAILICIINNNDIYCHPMIVDFIIYFLILLSPHVETEAHAVLVLLVLPPRPPPDAEAAAPRTSALTQTFLRLISIIIFIASAAAFFYSLPLLTSCQTPIFLTTSKSMNPTY